MASVPKYLLILEAIHLDPLEKNDLARVHKNVEIFKKHIEPDLGGRSQEILRAALLEDCKEIEWKYSVYLYQIILSVMDEVNFDSDIKDELISTKHLNNLISAIQDVSIYGLRAHLLTQFRSHQIFMPNPTENPSNIDCLKISLEAFRRILQIRKFQSGGALNEVLRDYIAGILTIIERDLTNEIHLPESERKQYQNDLNTIWKLSSKCEYFRTILLFKGLPSLPPVLQKRLHAELLNKLMCKGGFTNFVTILFSNRSDDDTPESYFFEIVAKIVAAPGHSPKFYSCLIVQIFDFLKLCVINRNMAECMGAGLLTLKRLYELNDATQKEVLDQIRLLFQKLSNPEDVLSGLILMEHREFSSLCNFLFTCFCSSSMECLPSELLIKYLPLLLSTYSYIPDKCAEKAQIRGAIVRCLANRSRTELDKIIKSLVSKKYPDDWVELHPRVLVQSNENFSQLTVKVTSPDAQVEQLNISNVLPELLIASNHNILMYVVFLCLLGMMQEALEEDDQSTEHQIDLVQSEEELITFLNSKYPVKVEIILCLSTMVNHAGLKTQISENAGEFLDFLRTFVKQRSSKSSDNKESTDHTLLLMLTITQEMIENSRILEKFKDFSKVLRDLQKQTPNELILHKIDKLLELLEGGLKVTHENKSNQYNVAKNLMKEKETHLRAYGINIMIEMLRRREKDALVNGHVTLALALHLLKEPESYIFLNCVRLFVALVNVMEAEVLETLSDEYLNKANKMDYRLVVGEAILKITKEMGEGSYKYKNTLVNCFMHGCRSEVDEFRWSSFSNLATLCRTLTFQVHSFFHEMLTVIENELQTGKYIPAKRAAVLVLSELLLGMDNLLDNEEYLLPVYRVLKRLSTDSDDEKIRIHAANGLKAISEKCKKFLLPEEKIEKEIKIMGIKDSPTKKPSGHILELN